MVINSSPSTRATPGKSIALDQFYIAQPGKANAAAIDAALAAGKHILFTPGQYPLDGTLKVAKPDTIILGLGIPSLVPTKGQPAIAVADVEGVTIAGLILDAGAVKWARGTGRIGCRGRARIRWRRSP
jgi:hypothetical protein